MVIAGSDLHPHCITRAIVMRKPSLGRRHPAAMWTVTAAYLVCLVAGYSASHQCSSLPRHSSMGITVLSRRNKTGHWIAQMNFTHDSDLEGRRSSGPWKVDFNQTTTVCESDETVLIVATLISVPVAAEVTNNSSSHRVDDSQYVVVDGVGTYKLHTNPKTWEDARKKCVSEDGHLAVINSEAEAKAILGIWQQNTRLKNYFVFLGFNDLNGEGRYVTVKGEMLEDTGYNDWEKGQPDDSRRENCGGLNRSGKLHDLSCTTKIPFFCEKNQPTP